VALTKAALFIDMLTISEDNFISNIKEMELCTNCELHLTRTQVAPYRGDPRTDIMVIAEAPGAEEDKTGIAVIGRSGSYLINIFTNAGLPIEDIFVTNTILCRPKDNAAPNNRQLEQCAKWINKLIEMVDPKVIIAVGRIACIRIIPEIMDSSKKMDKIEGQFFTSMYYDGRVVVPLRHPSAILRQPTTMPLYEKNVTNIIHRVMNLVSDPPSSK